MNDGLDTTAGKPGDGDGGRNPPKDPNADGENGAAQITRAEYRYLVATLEHQRIAMEYLRETVRHHEAQLNGGEGGVEEGIEWRVFENRKWIDECKKAKKWVIGSFIGMATSGLALGAKDLWHWFMSLHQR